MQLALPALHLPHRFKSRHSPCHGVCGISIFQSGRDLAVVVVSEMSGNTGMSVSSGFEHIATSVKNHFLPAVDASQIIWVERRMARTARHEGQGEIVRKETFDLVTLTADGDGYTSPVWSPLGERSPSDFWRILFMSDQPLSPFPDFDSLAIAS